MVEVGSLNEGEDVSTLVKVDESEFELWFGDVLGYKPRWGRGGSH